MPGRCARRRRWAALRETFFASQVAYAHALHYLADGGDFVVDDRWLFEVGRPGKTGRQIVAHGDACLVLDDIEHGWGRRVPLWMFGFLYWGGQGLRVRRSPALLPPGPRQLTLARS